jgi:hypothetical protein
MQRQNSCMLSAYASLLQCQLTTTSLTVLLSLVLFQDSNSRSGRDCWEISVQLVL